MLLFENRTALVTGGARGIGRAICTMLAEQGARVAINYQRNTAAAEETYRTVQASSPQSMLVQADVSDPVEVERMVREVRAKRGPIDLRVNNAGIVESLQHGELTFTKWKKMFSVNVDGPFLVTWAVKDEMLAQQFGRIVNISSLAGVVKKPDLIHYATTKAAVIAFTRHCSDAFAPHVRVNCVAPGLTNTDMAYAANPAVVDKIIAATPLGRMADPKEIAAVVQFLLSEASSFVTGQTIVACGGRT